MNTMPRGVDLVNKKILLRCDFDVPVVDGRIVEKFRIRKQKPAIDFLLKQSAVVMVAHISAVKSFKDVLPEIEILIGHKFEFIEDLENFKSKVEGLVSGQLYLLDNIRNWPGEEKNDESFAKTLADGLDLYVNNAFAVSHRRHASVSAVTKFIPSYAGPLLEEEAGQLGKVINAPAEGKIFIMGGAKAKTKIPVIKNFIDKSDSILLGGVVANDILVKRGIDIKSSVFDSDFEELLIGLDTGSQKLILPEDFIFSEDKILDIGPKAIKKYEEAIKDAKMVIWNGPMGLFENDKFAEGTDSIARAMSIMDGSKIIGGGDTISAVDRLGLLDKFDFVSTGGGAMLAFLAGEKLPGLEALEYYK